MLLKRSLINVRVGVQFFFIRVVFDFDFTLILVFLCFLLGVHHPLMYFPAFYCTKELVMADKPDFGKVIADYKQNMKEDLLALWKIWLPATLFNFAFMPMHLRIPFAAGVSLLWTGVSASL